MPDTLQVLRYAAAAGLPGAAGPTNDEERRVTLDIVAISANEKMQGHLWSALQTGVLVADDEVVEDLHERLVLALRRCLFAEAWALEALGALDQAGLEARVLKGVALAHLDYDDPAERLFGDADLLVRREDYRQVMRALSDAGFARRFPPVRGWWEGRFAKSVAILPPGDGELDLHMAITDGYFGLRVDHHQLFESPSEPFDLGGRPTVGLDREGRLLQACCHAVLGGASGLRTRRDIAQLILVSHADWRLAVDRAAGQGVEAVIAAALRATWHELGLDPTHPAAVWAADHRADAAQQEALASYNAQSGDSWGGEGRGMLAALGPVDRLLFLGGLAFPTRANRRWRGRTWRAHVRRGVGIVRRST